MYKGDLASGKWVAFYVYHDEIVGFVTCGYQNLHLYLLEAMKNLVMPPATIFRSFDNNFENIVNAVLNIRHDVLAKRKLVLRVASVMRAEFTHETEKLNELRGRMNK